MWFHKAIFWFIKKVMLYGSIPSLFLVILSQTELAIISYGTLGVIVGIAVIHFYYKAQLLVYDNLGVSRVKLYGLSFLFHGILSILAFIIYIIL